MKNKSFKNKKNLLEFINQNLNYFCKSFNVKKKILISILVLDNIGSNCRTNARSAAKRKIR